MRSDARKRILNAGHSEYGGGAGSNRTAPDGNVRDLSPSEQRQDLYRAAHDIAHSEVDALGNE